MNMSKNKEQKEKEINNKNYSVYMHINKTNNKIYVGQTCQQPEVRWNRGRGYRTCTYFNNAIKKYGWDNFEHIILYSGLSLDEANSLEKRTIEYYNTTNSKYGYNIRFGGKNTKLNDDTKEKIRKSLKLKFNSREAISKFKIQNGGINNPMYGKKQSEEAKNKISQKAIERFKIKENHPLYGVPCSEDRKEKIRKANLNLGKYSEDRLKNFKDKNKNVHKICKVDRVTKEIIEVYDSKNDAIFSNNLKRLSLSFEHKQYLYSRRYIWMYEELYEKIINSSEFKNKYINILQYSMDGELVGVWGCIEDIKEALNFKNTANISRALHNANMTSNGFIWKYETVREN